jgi:hypothetical protein
MTTNMFTKPVYGDRVEIYWNLHKKVFSVRALDGPRKGRVVAHVRTFDLIDTDLVVQPGGRKRVLETHSKNVHAFIRGTWATDKAPCFMLRSIFYSPYRCETFVRSFDNYPVTRAALVSGWISEYDSPRLGASDDNEF